MKISVIIPVYNEIGTIEKILEKVEKVDLGSIRKEIIIVDDFSRDGTRDILRNIKKHKVLFHKKNFGKGTAIRTGLKNATGDIIVIQDSDLEYNPEDYKKMIRPILEGKSKVVYGSRFIDTRMWISHNKIPIPTHYFGNMFLSFLTRIIYLRRITDMETCYKMFTREVIESIRLRARRFDFEPEITAKIIRRGYKIIEVPIEYHSRSFKEGKKINWVDGIKAFWYLLRYRFFD